MTEKPPPSGDEGDALTGASYRVPKALYARAKEATEANGVTITSVIIRALERYVAAYERKNKQS